MVEKLYGILRKHRLPLKKREEIMVDLLNLFSVSRSALLDDLKVTNSLYEERQKLLDAIPECEAHGKCVPHALEWIDKAKSHCG